MDVEDFSALNVLGELRTTSRMTAYAVRADECRECGKCIAACPEGAIELLPLTSCRLHPLLGGSNKRCTGDSYKGACKENADAYPRTGVLGTYASRVRTRSHGT
jgi:ferredoxin